MRGDAAGRIDTYLAFLRLGLKLLRPGGYGMFVLPHSFLFSDNARSMRQWLSEDAWIRILADLSAIRVFGTVDTYVVLLIFEKKRPGDVGGAHPATIVKCQDFVGHALEDTLMGRVGENAAYTIYEATPSDFTSAQWVVLPPAEASLRRVLTQFPPLDDFVLIREGIVTGADDVFIVDETSIDAAELSIFVPMLPDRLMQRYSVPVSTGKLVFYPYRGGERLSTEQLAEEYPRTWKYLLRHERTLRRRRSVEKGEREWWEPERPRRPAEPLSPKIVSPHLVLSPRFALDRDGRYAVSHSPYMVSRVVGLDNDLLVYLTGILNSPICYWYIATHSHKYSHGYAMLERKTLRTVPVPSLERNPTATLRLVALVERAMPRGVSDSMSTEMDRLVAELYGVSDARFRALYFDGLASDDRAK
jgi:hypothetical protein